MSVVVLTGASKGLGLAIARIVLDSSPDSKLVAVARSATELKNLQSQYGDSRVATVVGDVCEEGISAKIVKTAVSEFGKIDSLILNAGTLEPVEHVSDANVKEWKKLFDVNFFSVVDLVSSAIPELRKTKGSILSVSSGASVKPYDAWGAYGASKAALDHLSMTVNAEEENISTLSIAPGVVDTSMQQRIRENCVNIMKPEAHKRFTDLYANKELLAPEVAGAVYANLALKGIPKDLSGKYLRYDSPLLSNFTN